MLVQQVAICKAIKFYIRYRRMSVAEIYSLVSEVLYIA